MIASFVFEFDAYCVNGHATHANASVAAESRPAEAGARRAPSPSSASTSKRIDVKCTAGQRVPLAAPAEDRSSPGCRRGTRPGRRCRRAGSRSRSGRSSGCGRAPRRRRRPGRTSGGRPSTGKCPYGLWPCADAVGADHARVADVDHVRRADVQADAKARRGTPSPRPAPRPARPRRRGDGRSRAPDPDAAHEQPEKRRVRERHRREDVAVVEEPERHRERRRRTSRSSVAQRERPPPVDEPDAGRSRRTTARPGSC